MTVLLCLALAGAGLACIGLWRLPAAMDRLHLAAFATLAAGLPLLVAAAMTEGVTIRVAKLAAVIAVNLLAGAAGSHALGRALRHRGDA